LIAQFNYFCANTFNISKILTLKLTSFLIFACLLLTSSPGFAQNSDDIQKVTAIYKEIAKIVNSGNLDNLQRFVDNEVGLIEIIDPNGVAFPIFYPSIAMAKVQGVFISAPNAELQEATLPEFDCNLGIWTRTGSFISAVKGYPELDDILEEAAEVTYIDQNITKTSHFLSEEVKIVVMTTDESLLGFYKKDGIWWLGLIDNSFHCVE